MPQRQPRSGKSKAQPNQATSQPNMSVGDMIRQAERNAARSNGEAGDNGENAPIAHPGVASGVEVLSDTMGVDFGPYLHQVVQMTQSSWDLLIPEAARPPLLKQGTVAIQFIILPDGSIKSDAAGAAVGGCISRSRRMGRHHRSRTVSTFAETIQGTVPGLALLLPL